MVGVDVVFTVFAIASSGLISPATSSATILAELTLSEEIYEIPIPPAKHEATTPHAKAAALRLTSN